MRSGFDWFFRNRRTGAITIAQFPNLPLWIFIGALLLRRIADPAGTARTVLDVVSTLALGWWAGDELLRGVNPFRRMLGGGVLALLIVSVFASRI